MRNKRGRESYESLIASLRDAVEETEELDVELDTLHDLVRVIEDEEALCEIQALADRIRNASASIMATAIAIDFLISHSPHISDDSEGGDDAR